MMFNLISPWDFVLLECFSMLCCLITVGIPYKPVELSYIIYIIYIAYPVTYIYIVLSMILYLLFLAATTLNGKYNVIMH